MQLMCGCKLHAVVATQGEGLGEDTSFFDQRLCDIGDRNPAWFAPLKRVRWANAAIDSAQVILQTAIPSEEERALIMLSLSCSSTNSLRSAEVSQKRITVLNHDPQSQCRSSVDHHHSA